MATLTEDLTPIYYRVSPAVWRQRWTEPMRYLALYLLTCQHRTAEGLFMLPIPYICADLKWSPEQLAEPFGKLIDDGFVDHDNEADTCLIVKALAYQTPANPNMITAAVRRIATVPESRLDDGLFHSAHLYCQPLAERLLERLPERFGKPQLFSALLNSSSNDGGEREATPRAPLAAVAGYCTCGCQLQPRGDGTTDLRCPACDPVEVT